MKKMILTAFIFINFALTASAKISPSAALAMDSGSQRSATILINETTGEACVVGTIGMATQGLNMCTEQEKAEAERLSSLPRDPKFASVGAIVLDYYLTCSLIQFSPDIFDAITGFYDKRSTFEKIKDTVAPNEARKDLNAFREGLQKFTDGVTGTLCLPVGAANKKLLQIYNSN